MLINCFIVSFLRISTKKRTQKTLIPWGRTSNQYLVSKILDIYRPDRPTEQIPDFFVALCSLLNSAISMMALWRMNHYLVFNIAYVATR